MSKIIHKKRPTRWNRDGYKAPCGADLLLRLPLFNVKDLKNHSYQWSGVNCKECLKFLEVVKVEVVRKFKVK